MRRPVVLALLLAAVLTGGCQQSVFDLEVGRCLNLPEDLPEGGAIADVEPVECGVPHDAEIYAIVSHPAPPGSPFPGEEALREFSDERCVERFEAYVGVDYAISSIFSTGLRPLEDSWSDDGVRDVVCLLVGFEGAQLTGSKRGSGE